LLQVTEGEGTLIASEMELNQGTKDPIAAKLMVNLIKYLVKK
jgi:NhaP-type Na+/H+ and K+/H+ antiporter